MKLEELGKLVSGLPHKMYGQFETADALLSHVNEAVTKAAMDASGVRADQLSDENLEDKPIVRLYWNTVSDMWSKVLIQAAQEQTYYKELG